MLYGGIVVSRACCLGNTYRVRGSRERRELWLPFRFAGEMHFPSLSTFCVSEYKVAGMGTENSAESIAQKTFCGTNKNMFYYLNFATIPKVNNIFKFIIISSLLHLYKAVIPIVHSAKASYFCVLLVPFPIPLPRFPIAHNFIQLLHACGF